MMIPYHGQVALIKKGRQHISGRSNDAGSYRFVRVHSINSSVESPQGNGDRYQGDTPELGSQIAVPKMPRRSAHTELVEGKASL